MRALAPWRPFQELERWRRNFEQGFPRLFEDWPFRETGEDLMPPIESYVKDNNLIVRADMPGMEAKDVDISVMGNVLTIKGERKDQKEAKEQDYIRRELSYGSFERRMTLPEGVTADKVKAEFKNGVVEVTMPLAKQVEATKIPLQEAKN